MDQLNDDVRSVCREMADSNSTLLLAALGDWVSCCSY